MCLRAVGGLPPGHKQRLQNKSNPDSSTSTPSLHSLKRICSARDTTPYLGGEVFISLYPRTIFVRVTVPSLNTSTSTPVDRFLLTSSASSHYLPKNFSEHAGPLYLCTSLSLLNSVAGPSANPRPPQRAVHTFAHDPNGHNDSSLPGRRREADTRATTLDKFLSHRSQYARPERFNYRISIPEKIAVSTAGWEGYGYFTWPAEYVRGRKQRKCNPGKWKEKWRDKGIHKKSLDINQEPAASTFSCGGGTTTDGMEQTKDRYQFSQTFETPFLTRI